MLDRSDVYDRDALAAQLESMGQTVRGAASTCPWHDDKTPSASLFSDTDGHWRIKCHKCDRSDDVYGLRGTKPSQDKAQPEKVSRINGKRPPPAMLGSKDEVKSYCERLGAVAAWYKYGLPEAPRLIIAKVIQPGGRKTFRQFTPVGERYAVGALDQRDLPLYRAHELAEAGTVLVVEGEKCADAAWGVGIPATTSAGGAQAADKSDWSSLAGKRCVLWPDADAVGTKYMEDVAAILLALGCIVSRIDALGMGLADGQDLADMLAMWPTIGDREREMLRTLMDDAEALGSVAEMQEWHAAIAAGKWQALEWPLRALGAVSRASIPGTITTLCADPGAGKSWLMLQLMRFWHGQGVKSVVRMFEDGAYVHLARLLAQMTSNGGHTDDRWIRDNMDAVRRDLAEHKSELSALGSRITAETDELWSTDDLAKWCERTAKAGARVLMIDPITALKQSDKPWLQDFELAMHLKRIAKAHGVSIILTTHPRGSAKEPALTAMSGGVAWPRFSHTVMWLEMHRAPQRVKLWAGGSAMANRTMHILKCRNGRGAGARIALNFGDDVSFSESGLIAADDGEAEDDERKPRHVPEAPSPAEDLFA